jgi:hypothetical protein
LKTGGLLLARQLAKYDKNAVLGRRLPRAFVTTSLVADSPAPWVYTAVAFVRLAGLARESSPLKSTSPTNPSLGVYS